MKRRLVLAGALTAVLVPAAAAGAAEQTLPGGTSIGVNITSPTALEPIVAGEPLTVQGTASVAEGVALKNTDLVFVLDTSGSTGSTSGVNCDGVGGNDSILLCEKQAVIELSEEAAVPSSAIDKVGIAAFPVTATLGLTSPSEATAIAGYLNTLSASGATDFSAGVSRALTILGSPNLPENRERTIVLLTDGASTANAVPLPAEIDAVIRAFTIAGAGCSDPNLTAIVSKGLAGSGCTPVTDLSQLTGVISQSIGSTLAGVTVTVDGGDPQVATTVPGTPAGGPATVDFALLLDGGLTAGPHTICATATGSDAVGEGSVEDCVTVEVLPAGTVVLDCEGGDDCTGGATDPGKSTLAFSAPGEFEETVVIEPIDGGDCGGQPCRTAYHVAFPPPAEGKDPVRASITVVTEQPVKLLDRLRAAVYIDDTRITAQCNESSPLLERARARLGQAEPIPCISIRWLRDGRLEYYVEFDADPAFRFR